MAKPVATKSTAATKTTAAKKAPAVKKPAAAKKAATPKAVAEKKVTAQKTRVKKAVTKTTATKKVAAKKAPAKKKTGDQLILTLTHGKVVINLRPDLAPLTVARIKELAGKGFYDGTPFHRVIPGFMAQGGDPTGTGRGGSGQNIKAEFSRAPHGRGTVSMARAQHPDSADSQFFICFDNANFLDGQYTVFGQVESGMEFVDMIKKGSQSDNGSVQNPDKIVTLKVG